MKISNPSFSLANIIGETQELIRRQLWAKIILFLILGVATGFVLSPEMGWVSSKISGVISDWLALPGRIFLILMQMIILPLVLTSVILGVVNSESIDSLKRIALRLFPYFVATTATAIVIGFVAAQTIAPGHYMDRSKFQQTAETQVETSSIDGISQSRSVTESITSVLPKNPLGSMLEGNLFQIVLFSLLIGIALLSLPKDQAEPLVVLLQSVQRLTMTIVNWAMYLAPVAVFGLMAELLSQVGFEALRGIGAYAFTVVVALIGILLFYMLLIFFGARRNPFQFLKSARAVQLLAFSTSSSAAVMPLTIETAEKELKVSPEISRFVIPLGTTINMDGTAAYQGVAACFIAQVYGMDLSMGQIALIVVSATGASIGAPGTPGVGIAILASLLKGIGVPSEGVLLIIGIDRLLDMCRTVVNVTGDLTASVFFNRLIGPIDDSDFSKAKKNL
ncbi:MAG TPA: dicarboxylate/amino acid:cation symporter [Bdellovibrionales bacterium]|nr:dicarboxylate/amino acid:cation symporter [Pseudobdellovibrionaceae bacterium]HAG91806.1 dicarboxylate/amino acid:cation symporter [Bdellovibrionales bacterium]|tara:strand:- start:106388 stop:107737 length:1350 start_codon:yes stop_codon:yes gene_type:complete